MFLRCISVLSLFFTFVSLTQFCEAVHADNNKAYTKIKNIYLKPESDKITSLKALIHEFPQFHFGYRKLYHEYLISHNLNSAKNFFTQTSKESKYARQSYLTLAEIYTNQDSIVNALDAYRLALSSAGLNRPEEIFDFFLFAKKHFASNDFLTAIESVDFREMDKLVVESLLFYVQLDFEKAIRSFGKLSPDVASDTRILFGWGNCYRGIGEYEKADSLWRKGLQLAINKNEKEFIIWFYRHLAILPAYLKTETGLAYMDSAYSIAKQINDLEQLEYLAGNQGIVFRDAGDFKKAQKFFNEAIQIAEQFKSYWGLAIWNLHNGRLLHYLDRFDEALYFFEMSGKYAQESYNEEVLIRKTCYTGDLYRDVDLLDIAVKAFDLCYLLALEKKFSEFLIRARWGKALIYQKQKRYSDAEKIYREFLSEYNNQQASIEHRANWWLQLGRIYYETEQLCTAELAFKNTIKFAELSKSDYLIILAHVGLGQVYLRDRQESQSMQSYQSALEIATSKNDKSTLPAIHLGIGELLQNQGEIEQALRHFLLAAKYMEATRSKLSNQRTRLQYSVSAAKVYDKIIACFYYKYEQTQSEEELQNLYRFLEMTRGRSLRELISQRGIRKKDDESGANEAYQNALLVLQQKQRLLREKYYKSLADSMLQQTLDEIVVAKSSVVALRLNIAFHDSTQNEDNFSVRKLQNYLHQQNMGTIIYQISEELSFAFVVTTDRVKIVSLDIDTEALQHNIESLMLPFHNLAENSIDNTVFKADVAHQLYRDLVEPIKKSLGLQDKLIIVPDMELTNLPFEMLLTQKPPKADYTPTERPEYSASFLLNDYTLVYSPTSFLLQKTSAWKLDKPSLLVYAKPEDRIPRVEEVKTDTSAQVIKMRTGMRFSPLPFTKIEAQKIAGLIPDATVRQSTEATTGDFSREYNQYDIIHISGHGFVDTTYDAFSGLVLAMDEDPNDDGILMGYEISELQLNADLVSLSACETGRGRLVAGEGVLGLPRLLLAAGAKSVLMTLWKIDDYFASQLMPEFYDQFINKGQSKAGALTSAKRLLLEKEQPASAYYFQHPLFWAAYTLYGDPGQRPIDIKTYRTIIMMLPVLVTCLFFVRKRKLR